MAEQTLFEELGSEPALRAIIDRFVDRVFDDVMIGFFFRHARRERVKAKEYEFAARHLGGPVEYTGRAIDEAHRAHPIMGGQFQRRLVILRDTLREFGVPPHIEQHWLEHTASLRGLVTRDAATECDPTRAAAKVAEVPNAPLPGSRAKDRS